MPVAYVLREATPGQDDRLVQLALQLSLGQSLLDPFA
jgi:hypothetical protein